jgi:hypothetical protein
MFENQRKWENEETCEKIGENGKTREKMYENNW